MVPRIIGIRPGGKVYHRHHNPFPLPENPHPLFELEILVDGRVGWSNLKTYQFKTYQVPRG